VTSTKFGCYAGYGEARLSCGEAGTTIHCPANMRWGRPVIAMWSGTAAGKMTDMPKPGAETTNLTCTYDAWNRLVEVSGNGLDVTYAYDGLGRMIERTSGGTVTHYYYAGQQMIETRSGSPGVHPESLTPQYQYVWSAVDPDAPVLRDTFDSSGNVVPADRIYYLTDANDNVTALVSAAGSVVERYVYDAYGNVTVCTPAWVPVAGNTSTVNNTLLFTGQEQDPQTGLYYCRARWYNPSTGDWMSRDPAQSDANLYRYVDDDPISLQDPSGLAIGGRGWQMTRDGFVIPHTPRPSPGPCSGTGAPAAESPFQQPVKNPREGLTGWQLFWYPLTETVDQLAQRMKAERDQRLLDGGTDAITNPNFFLEIASKPLITHALALI